MSPSTTYLKDYQPPHYFIEQADLIFTLGEEETLVTAQLHIRANNHDGQSLPLVLQGEETELLMLKLNGQLLSKAAYECTEETLTLPAPGASFELETTVRIHPETNLALSGLYKSSGNFCTQCEAEGFRRITYYIDRPDNLAVFTTTIIADKTNYPILLSNGNNIDQGELPDNQHFVKWQDPFKKAGHLFALVAGKLDCLSDHFMTMSGRKVELKLFVEKGQLEKTAHAMAALKWAMRWDEKVYGREYDLDIFMIVAVSDFNMGAMENKGLNIFNSKYILATPTTATDLDFENITRVVGHEYFHNWSGNRVGCRDWFQLSLKEGFTVFRDQSFTADMTSPAVKRIEDIRTLRSGQFVEDAGPMAHAVRPDAYMEINNFYTMTIYEKGAEVIRMLHTLLGAETFRKATDLYFTRYDGQATTTDNFVSTMAEVSGLDLTQFRLWYDQAGTPILSITDEYNAAKQEYILSIRQETKPTPTQAEKSPQLIPFKIGLLNEQGEEIFSDLINITQAESRFVLPGITSQPIPSFLRGLSAPVKLHYAYTNSQLKILLAHDTDPFACWEAGQCLAIRQLQKIVVALQRNEDVTVDSKYLSTLSSVLKSPLDPAFKALLMTLPSEAYLADFVQPIDPLAIYQARKTLQMAIAKALYTDFIELYQQTHTTDMATLENNTQHIGKRALKNMCLAYLMSLALPEAQELAETQYKTAINMTDRFAALSSFIHLDVPRRESLLEDFYKRFQTDPVVLDKWFAVQASSSLPGTLEALQILTTLPNFDIRNPNKVRALFTTFAKNNPMTFHALDGSGYAYLANRVRDIDAFNPQIAARLVEPLTHWKRFKAEHAELMKIELDNLLKEKLSKDTFEIVSKALA
jgi:aminopeptidase N